jgi:hypothetical protein
VQAPTAAAADSTHTLVFVIIVFFLVVVIVITAHTLQVRKLRSFNHITGIIVAVAAAAAISRCRQVQMLSQVRRC